MDRDRKHSRRHGEKRRSKKSHKKKRSRENSVSVSSILKPLVEYSDVSSEDLSAPEAGEIESEGSFSVSDGERVAQSRILKSSKLIIDLDDSRSNSFKVSKHKISVSGHRLDVIRTPSPSTSVASGLKHRGGHERKNSSSDDSRLLKQYESKQLRDVISPSTNVLDDIDEETERRRRKKEKKHKKEKKAAKKKKKKNKRKSRSTSVESTIVPQSPSGSPGVVERSNLSDWEPPSPNQFRITDSPGSIKPSVQSALGSPVSPGSLEARPLSSATGRISDSPRTRTPPLVLQKSYSESPHTPILPPKAYESNSAIDVDTYDSYSGRKSPSPIIDDRSPRTWTRGSISPVPIKSPYRNPSPDVMVVKSNRHRESSQPRKRRKVEKESYHKRYRRERDHAHFLDRIPRHLSRSRSRSPSRTRRRISRSPSWTRASHYERHLSHSRSHRKYRSRSPRSQRPASPKTPPPSR